MCALGAGDASRYYQRFSHDVGLNDWLIPNARHEQLALLVRKLVPRRRGQKILDVGCGAGVMSARLRRHGEVTGVDFSAPAIELARTLVPDVRFVVGDVTVLDLGEPFDVICAFDVLEHIPLEARRGVLRALCDRLTEPGLMIFSTPQPGNTRHIRATRPDLLQIVDEEVEPDALIGDLHGLGLDLAEYHTYDIQSAGQYQLAMFRTRLDRQGAPAIDPTLQRHLLLTTNAPARRLRRAIAAAHAWRRGSREGARILMRARPPEVAVSAREEAEDRTPVGAP